MTSTLRRWAGQGLAGVRQAPYLRKWLVLGSIIGLVAGLGAVVFYDGLHLATHLLLGDIGGYTPAGTAGEGGVHAASGFSRPWAIPLVVGGGGLVAGLLVFGLAPEAEGHGTDAAIKAVHTNPKGVRPRVIAVKLLASAITIASGGSGGREGPTAQISSGFGSVMARALNLTPADSRLCVAAGIASGIGAIFRAPFGGALLGVELLYTDDVEIEALIPSVVATVVGYAVFCAITGSTTPVFGDHSGAGVAHTWELALFVGVGLVCGLVGRLYTWAFYWVTDRTAGLRTPRALAPAVAGVAVGALGLAVPGVLGTGYGQVQAELDPHLLLGMPLWVVLVLPLAKIAATALSIGSGGSGGIFGPGMVIGGGAGAGLWRLAHLAGLGPHDQVAFVIVGMAAAFAAIAHAPIAVLIMVAEMTGSLGLLPAAMVAVALASLVAGETTIYRSQLPRRADAAGRRLALGPPDPGRQPVTEVMSPPRLVLPAATPGGDALEQLRRRGLPGAPVVDRSGAFIGSLQTPPLAAAVAAGTATSAGALADLEAMTLPAEASFDAALDALAASRGGWVPVLDDRMGVVGIVATAELVRGWQRSVGAAARQLAGALSATAVIEGTIPSGSEADGALVADLGLPRGTIVASAIRAGAVVDLAAPEPLAAGDEVTVLTRAADAPSVRRRLGLPDAGAAGPQDLGAAAGS